MPIKVRRPGPLSAAEVGRRLRYYPQLDILDDGDQLELIDRIESWTPSVEFDLDVPILAVQSPMRESFLYPGKEGFVVVDDVLRRNTFQVCEEFTYTLDRPLIPWTYFGLVLGEMLPVSGIAEAADLLSLLAVVVDSSVADRLSPDGYIERSSLMARTIKLNGETRTEEERRLEEAAEAYAIFHEIAHLLLASDNGRAQAINSHLMAETNKAFRNSRLRDIWALYWQSPSAFAADPSFGPLRIDSERSTDVDDRQRDDAIEELACDWIATSLLLLSNRFSTVDPGQLIAVVLRHLSVNQLLTDARNEIKQIAAGRKRFRPLVSDLSSLRQARLLATLFDTKLAKLLFGRQERRRLAIRLKDLPSKDLAEACTTATNRRQFIRSLCLHYPSPEDVAVFADLDERRQHIHRGYSPGVEALMVQPAEWGVTGHDRFVQDLTRYAGRGRLDDQQVEWDDAERLMPYIAEGYHILLVLRREWFAQHADPNRTRGEEPLDVDQALRGLNIANMMARQSMIRWLGRDLDTAVLNVFAVCLACHVGFRADLVELSDRIPPDLPLSEPWPIACPTCGESPIGHSLMPVARRVNPRA